jgi:hypothetical protein
MISACLDANGLRFTVYKIINRLTKVISINNKYLTIAMNLGISKRYNHSETTIVCDHLFTLVRHMPACNSRASKTLPSLDCYCYYQFLKYNIMPLFFLDQQM